jgi:ribosome-associated translation inhibitor RaiA
MRLEFRLRGSRSSAALRRFVRDQVEGLRDMLPVTSAQVVLERDHRIVPAWSAQAHLRMPGPDLKASARDHTLQAAWRKVMEELHHQITRRLERRRWHPEECRRNRPVLRSP